MHVHIDTQILTPRGAAKSHAEGELQLNFTVPGEVTCTTCQSEVLSLAGPNVTAALRCAGKLDLCSSRHSERDREAAGGVDMWDFCEPAGEQT